MSFCSWHNYGYGVKLTYDHDKAVSVERLQKLLALAPDFNKSVTEWLEDCDIEDPTVEDYFDFDQDFNLGLAALIKEVIEEAEGIELCAYDDFDAYKYVLYLPMYPWQMNEKNLQLTEEALKELFKKYLSIIFDDVPDIDYQECENGG